MSNPGSGEQTRAQFMAADGQELYGSWTRAVIDATVTDEFLTNFPEQVKGSKRKDRLADPKGIFSAERIKGQLSRAMQEVDTAEGITRELLMPSYDDIVTYTDAGYFGDRTKRSGAAQYERVFTHAHTGLQFGLGASAGFVFDSFLEAYIQADELGVLGIDNDMASKQAEIGRFMGPLWDNAFNLPPDDQDPLFIWRSIDLQKLAFIARSLTGNPSVVDCLVDLSNTGFGVLGGRTARVGDDQNLRMIWDKDLWRSARLGIMSERFTAAMPFDETTQTFSVLPQVTHYLQAAKERQNAEGLSLARDVSTSLKKFKQDFTIGCPIPQEIPITALTMGRAIQSVAEYHRD